MSESAPVFFVWIKSDATCPVHGSLRASGDQVHGDARRHPVANIGDNVLKLTTPDGQTTYHCGICWAEWWRSTFPDLS